MKILTREIENEIDFEEVFLFLSEVETFLSLIILSHCHQSQSIETRIDWSHPKNYFFSKRKVFIRCTFSLFH